MISGINSIRSFHNFELFPPHLQTFGFFNRMIFFTVKIQHQKILRVYKKVMFWSQFRPMLNMKCHIKQNICRKHNKFGVVKFTRLLDFADWLYEKRNLLVFQTRNLRVFLKLTDCEYSVTQCHSRTRLFEEVHYKLLGE